MGDEYTINTISDLMKVPIDRLSACLRDIEYAVCVAHMAVDDGAVEFEDFVWIDDGLHDVDMRLNDEPFVSLVTARGGEGNDNGS